MWARERQKTKNRKINEIWSFLLILVIFRLFWQKIETDVILLKLAYPKEYPYKVF